MSRTAQNILDPLNTPLIEFRSIGDCLSVREKRLDVVDTVLKGVCLHGLLQRANLMSFGNNALNCIMRENVLWFWRSVLPLRLEDVTSHAPSFLFIIIIIIIIGITGITVSQLQGSSLIGLS